MEYRKPLLAGTWYPDTFDECSKQIGEWKKYPKSKKKTYGGIVPHAGWYFSGETASMVIERLAVSAPELVIIFGTHLNRNFPIRVMVKGGYETPLGNLPVFEELGSVMAEQYEFVKETPFSFEPDNTIEVQLPVIRYFMGEVPVFCAGLPPHEKSLGFASCCIKEALKLTKNLVVIGSTDLTHYGPGYAFTPAGYGKEAFDWVKNKNDKSMVDLFIKMNAEEIIKEGPALGNACCSGAAAGAVSGAGIMGAEKGVLLSYSNSYEKSPGESFVGYAGVVFE